MRTVMKVAFVNDGGGGGGGKSQFKRLKIDWLVLARKNGDVDQHIIIKKKTHHLMTTKSKNHHIGKPKTNI